MARERSDSPSRLDMQRLAKKDMNENSDMDTLVESSAALDYPSSPNKGVVGSDNPILNLSATQKTSYANVVLEGNHSAPTETTPHFVDPDVFITHDDIIMNPYATISSIQFSDRVHDQEACEMAKTTDDCPRSPSAGNINAGVPKAPDISESNLFGPWMVVKSKRICNGAASNAAPRCNSNRLGGRFDVLQTEKAMEPMAAEHTTLDQVVKPNVLP
ncbi:hypothetical protein V6N13_088038 [Hibiscus sabdariffa]|uniref:Uncharacterized protein n=2 Tax=Hibiscus sabdariffa TaxID=183260 RepID=A0ABR1ZB27_9ROSI